MTEGPRSSLAVRWLLALGAWLVPRSRRREWREEWEAELEALESLRRRRGSGSEGYPSPVRFAWGAVWHGMWMRTEEWTMDGLVQDLRYALRSWSRRPGFALIAGFTLALGIGLNATLLSLVDGLLFRPPPAVNAPEELVQVARSYDDAPRWDNWSWPAYEVISASPAFAGVAGYAARGFLVGEGAEAESVLGLRVTGGYFDVLGLRPAAGRLLVPSDDVTPGAHPVVVLSHGFWVRRFGADPAAVGRTVSLSGSPYEVVGVAPEGFVGLESLGSSPALFVPTAMTPPTQGMTPFDQWGWSWLEVVGRRAPGVGFAEVQGAMSTTTAALRTADPSNPEIRVLVADGVGLSPADRREARTLAVLLLGIGALVLLVACTNVANLFVARASTRVGEMGVRMALGAGRGRLARQLTTESVLLGLVAAVAAVPLVLGGARALPQLLPFQIAGGVEPEARVFLALGALGVVAGVLFGGAPALAAARRDVAGVIREEAAPGGSRSRLRDALIVGQLALSLVLVATAGLLGRSVSRAAGAEPGFQPTGLGVVALDPGLTGRYEGEAASELVDRLLDEARTLPGVRFASVASQAPFMGAYSRAGVRPADRVGAEPLEAEMIEVAGDHLQAMGLRLVEGRAFEEDEPAPVMWVNRTLAEMFWPEGDAVGQRVDGPGPEPFRVVGVVDDVRYRSLRGAALPGFYLPMGEGAGDRFLLHLRTEGDPSALTAPVRSLVRELDPGIPVGAVSGVRDRMARSLGATRTVGVLAGIFAALAVVLAVVGLYGLMSFAVSLRVREMGIRKALGARPGTLQALVLRRGFALAAVGVLAGAALTVATGQALEHLLYEVRPWSPLVLGGSAVLLAAAALLASWWPARRASRVEAALSLRDAP